LSGDYDVAYAGATNACGAGQLPCNAGVFKRAVALHSDGALDLDVPAITVTGTVTLNGAAFIGANRGELSFARVGDAAYPLPLSGSDDSYRVVLMPGNYVLSYDAASVRCQANIDDTTPPCTGQIIRGCESL
jgi:hypothetical protein